MPFPFIKHPTTGTPDVIRTMIVVSVLAAVLKFLFDGVSFYFQGHQVNLGHVDAMAYGSLLGPVLAAHGYIEGKSSDNQKVDDPDK